MFATRSVKHSDKVFLKVKLRWGSFTITLQQLPTHFQFHYSHFLDIICCNVSKQSVSILHTCNSVENVECMLENSMFITSRVCGRGNVFVVSVCLCVCVCLSVWAITFEWVDIETSFLVWCYILTISRSSLSIKAIGSRSRSSHGKCWFCYQDISLT